jgi:DNA invertase Pin-like site-specific DNA recombinase
MKQVRIGIYCRVSTNRQENGNQLDQLREFVRQHPDWTIVLEFVDTVTGSGKHKRPEFEAMMLAASQKKFDRLVFWALDRLSREGVVKTIGYLQDLKSYGVDWHSYTQPFLASGNEMVDSIVLSVLSALAKQERVIIAERTRAGLERARKAGKKFGRPEVPAETASRQTLWRRRKRAAAAMASAAISIPEKDRPGRAL